MDSGEELRGAVLHLGPGGDQRRRGRGIGTGEEMKHVKYVKRLLKMAVKCCDSQMKVRNSLIKDEIYSSPSVCECCRQWGAPPGGSSGPGRHLTA